MRQGADGKGLIEPGRCGQHNSIRGSVYLVSGDNFALTNSMGRKFLMFMIGTAFIGVLCSLLSYVHKSTEVWHGSIKESSVRRISISI